MHEVGRVNVTFYMKSFLPEFDKERIVWRFPLLRKTNQILSGNNFILKFFTNVPRKHTYHCTNNYVFH